MPTPLIAPTAALAPSPTIASGETDGDASRVAPELASRGSAAAPVARPLDAAELARTVVSGAEAAFDAGRYREALDLLDAGPFPAELSDLVTLRRAELALQLGDPERTRAELRSPPLAASTNRMLLERAADVAAEVNEYLLQGEYLTAAARQPNWHGEKIKMLARAAVAFDAAHASDQAADMLAAVADGGGRSRELATMLGPLAELGSHHAGLIAVVRSDTAGAVAAFRRYLAQSPNGEYAAAAAKRLAALTRSRAGAGDGGWATVRETDTAAAYRVWWQANPDHPQAAEARFREGLQHYLNGRHAAAIEVWGTATGANVGVEERARALYWTGKSLILLKQATAANERWRAAAALRPSSYYSVRAADRLDGAFAWPDGGVTLPGVAPGAGEREEADVWLASWAPDAGVTVAEQTALGRAPLFASIGLERTAGAELDGMIERSESPRALYVAGQIALDNGLWMSAVKAGLRLGRLSPEQTAIDAPAAVRRMSYPPAFADAVQAEAGRRGIGPLLVVALLRQESYFDPFAVSSAGARGLSQVMPATGAEIARSAGRSGFSPDELFQPSVSIEFGARYIQSQLRSFDGDVFRAVAAYNAGGGAARRWAPDSNDPDVFVESIRYAETRTYVKSVYLWHAAYRSMLD